MKNLSLVVLNFIACAYAMIVCFIFSGIAFILFLSITIYQTVTNKADKAIFIKIGEFVAKIIRSCSDLHGLISLIKGDEK